MHRPDLFEIDYAHDRRTHRHRCQRCQKIVNSGERVVMYRVSAKVSRVLHVTCADYKTFGDITYRQLAQLHSDEYARGCGYKVPERDYNRQNLKAACA